MPVRNNANLVKQYSYWIYVHFDNIKWLTHLSNYQTFDLTKLPLHSDNIRLHKHSCHDGMSTGNSICLTFSCYSPTFTQAVLTLSLSHLLVLMWNQNEYQVFSHNLVLIIVHSCNYLFLSLLHWIILMFSHDLFIPRQSHIALLLTLCSLFLYLQCLMVLLYV